MEDFKNSTAFKTLPTSKSTDADWIKWVDLVESKYGANLGRQVFLAAWEKFGSQDANTRAFRKHIKDNYNIEIDESVWNKVADLGGGIADGIGKIFKVGKITLLVTAGLVVFAVIAVGVGYAKGNPLPIGPAGMAGAAAAAAKGGKK